jgi:hypothetical protein
MVNVVMANTDKVRPPSAHDCRFTTCRFLGTDYRVSVVRPHLSAYNLVRIAVPICNSHSKLLDDAKAQNLTINQTKEGWLWVDTIRDILDSGPKPKPDKAADEGPNKRQPLNSQCPARGPSLFHTRDIRMLSSGDCIFCGAPLL